MGAVQAKNVNSQIVGLIFNEDLLVWIYNMLAWPQILQRIEYPHVLFAMDMKSGTDSLVPPRS